MFLLKGLSIKPSVGSKTVEGATYLIISFIFVLLQRTSVFYTGLPVFDEKREHELLNRKFNLFGFSDIKRVH